MSLDILILYFYIQRCLCTAFILPLRIGGLLVLGLCLEDYNRFLDVCPFDCEAFAVSGMVWIR